MATFELHREYPLAQVFDGPSGFWIVPGLVKELSPAEAVILLRPSEKGRSEVVFSSSQVCLVHFFCDKAWPESEAIDRRLRSITKLWVFVASEQVATLLRVVPRPLSFIFTLEGRSTLTIPMEPSLSTAEWHGLGMRHVSVVTINEDERRHVGSEQDAAELCRYLRRLPSFWLHASRFEGGELDVAAAPNGAMVSYLDIKRATKMVSMNSADPSKDIVRVRVDALPDLEVEIERRHLIPVERGLGILRTFLATGEPIDMVPWPGDD
jgi:hypothetical protein